RMWCGRQLLGSNGSQAVHPNILSVIAGLVLVAACTPDPSSDSADSTSSAEPSWVPLASVYAWAETPSADDPFAQLRPADSTCAADGHGLHDLGGDPSYEINTGTCNYLSISQAALQELKAGTSVEFRVWHFDLDTALDDAGEAYLALDIDGHLVF